MLNDKDFLDRVSRSIGKDLSKMSLEKRQQAINRSRNYLRFKMAKQGVHYIRSDHPLLTPKEAEIVAKINQLKGQLESLTCQFYTDFYENCPMVGSTLKRKVRKIPGLITISQENFTDFI